MLSRTDCINHLKNFATPHCERMGQLQGRVLQAYTGTTLGTSLGVYAFSLTLVMLISKVTKYIDLSNRWLGFILGLSALSLAVWIGGTAAFCYFTQLPLSVLQVAKIITLSGLTAYIISPL